MTLLPERPRLRPGLAAAPTTKDPAVFMLWDNYRVTHRIALLRHHELAWAQLFDGRSTLHDVQRNAQRQNGGVIAALDELAELAEIARLALRPDGVRRNRRASPRYGERARSPPGPII